MASDADADYALFEVELGKPETSKAIENVGRTAGIPELDLEDFTQDVRGAVWKSRKSYRPSKGKLLTWILAIAGKKAANYWRQRNAEKRKLPSGSQSLDAPVEADNDTTRGEQVPDQKQRTPAELSGERDERRTTTERAKLTPKQIAALQSVERGAKSMHAAARQAGVSSGVVRRLKENLEQVWKPAVSLPDVPEAAECGYGRIRSAKERPIAFLYELARKTPWVVEAVMKWRNSPKAAEVLHVVVNPTRQDRRNFVSASDAPTKREIIQHARASKA